MGESLFRAGSAGIDDLIAGARKLAENRDELANLYK
jgi:hypothetical protein